MERELIKISDYLFRYFDIALNIDIFFDNANLAIAKKVLTWFCE